MSRIYQVTTPTGTRLVEANTRTQAISHCVATDYSAEPISSSDLYAAMKDGRQVEQAAIEKKSDTPAQSKSPELQGSLAPIVSPPPGSMTSAAAAPVLDLAGNVLPPLTSISLQQGAAVAAPAALATVSAAQAPESWTPPVHAAPPVQVQVHPVLAEQQRINPDAAAAAGAPILPRPIRNAAPPSQLPPEAPGEWKDRQ